MTKLHSFTQTVLTVLAMLVLGMIARAADPGLALSDFEASDDRPGSVLLFNIYTSSPAAPGTQNTRITITNTNDQSGIFVHLFFADGSNCSIADRYVCLSQLQTVTLLAVEQDPGTTGYLVAVATDSQGLSALFNYLIGDEYVKFSSGHFASLGAEAYRNLANAGEVNPDGTLGLVAFRTARVVAVDNIGSRADGNNALLILNRIGSDLTISTGLGFLFGILYDDAEQAHSFQAIPALFGGRCQLLVTLNNNFPKTVPRFDTVIPAGQTGWMKIWDTSFSGGISGSVINFSANSSSAAGAFNEGHNLHGLTTSFMGVQFPVIPPHC